MYCRSFTSFRIEYPRDYTSLKTSFGLEEKSQKTKTVCGLGRTNSDGLRNVQPPVIDPICPLGEP